MDEKTERPELGTTEAAVRSCVNLIALATHTDEEHLAYWLDCYYQLRKAHEDRLAVEEARIQMEEERAEILRSLLGRDDGPSRTPVPTEEDARATARVAPTEKIADGLPGGGPEGDKTWGEYLGLSRTPAPTEEDARATARVAPTEDEKPEAAAAQKKKKQGSADDRRTAKAAEP